MSHTRLTAAQARFCESYWRCRNASLAYREAYSAERCAAATIHRKAAALMKNGKVRARISELQAIADEEFRFAAHRVVEELAAIAFADPADFFGHDGQLRPPAEMPRAVRAAISSLHVRGSGTVEIKMSDKLRALALLAQLAGARVAGVDSRSELAALSDAELEDELARLDARAKSAAP